MIKHIVGSVSFTTPPITLAVDFQPQTGITAVVGPNGSGKSFAAVELTRYLLFGKAALRGAASDYKTLTAKGIFTIKGKDYVIERTPSREQIIDNTETLAVGAKAVTEKVVDLMGYGLAVFDIANASVQKQADSFGKMQPADRKRLIDRVVGMTSLEKIEKACRDEAQMFKREAEALEKVLPVIVPPTTPIVQFSDVIAQELKEAEEYDLVSRRKRTVQLVERPKGVLPSPEALNALESHERERQRTDDERHRLQMQIDGTARAPDVSLAELDKAEARERVAKVLRDRGPRPQLPAAESERYWAQHAVFDAYVPSPEIECPNCQYHFHVTGTPPPTPLHSKELLREDDARRAAWAAGELVVPDGLDMSFKQIELARKQWAIVLRNTELQSQLDALPRLLNREATLLAMRDDQIQWATYAALLRASEVDEAHNHQVEGELSRLVPPKHSIESLREKLTNAQQAEREWVAYDQSVIRRTNLTNQIVEKLRIAEEFRKGGAALSDARTTMKAYLAPAISRAASRLISDMTHGKLSSIIVDEDMEITVNGQRIETLSGGGETVANIALRIALGQVLVVDTFPVFIGDEMDADADDERREAVIQSLVALKEHLDQIIIVTHRSVEVADHVIDMKDTK